MAINLTYSKLILICSSGRHLRNATFEWKALEFCFSIVSVSAAILRRAWVFGNVPMPFQLHQLLQYVILPLLKTLPFKLPKLLNEYNPLLDVSFDYC